DGGCLKVFAAVVIEGRAITATIDTAATRSFMTDDYMRRQALRGKILEVQSRIRLADGSALEVKKRMEVEVSLAGQVVKMTVLVMLAMLGMDFLCAMDTTLCCGNAALTTSMKEELREEASPRSGRCVSIESNRSGSPNPLARPEARGRDLKECPMAGSTKDLEEGPEEHPSEVNAVELVTAGEFRSNSAPREARGILGADDSAEV
ncbi:hypothetical protein AWZ03_014632, partial [Drosophila navojoa]